MPAGDGDPSGWAVDDSSNIRHEEAGPVAALDGGTRKRSPNVLVTINDLVLQRAPTSRSTGITNQSLPYVIANSTSSMRARSCGAASTAPKSTRVSSNSQKRLAGIPRYETGAGIELRTRSSWAVSSMACSDRPGATSKSCQSSRPL